MEPSLNNIVLNIMAEAGHDDSLAKEINRLHDKDGDIVLHHFFKLLANIEIPLEDCHSHWISVQKHRKELSNTLSRTVDFTTAVCDYLQRSTHFLKHPRLIDATTFETIVKETIHDQLTGLFNRSYFDEAYGQQVSLAKRYENDLSILFLDLDNFKEVNDTYGHLAGDEVLRSVAALIVKEKRESDIAARYGGEEFVLILTQTDNLSGFTFAERLRKKIEKLEITYRNEVISITTSGGIASYPNNTESPGKILQMADSAAYLAKGAGKNKICQYKDEKRRYLRVNITQPIQAKELDFKDSPTFAGTSKNICVGGILFENPEPIPLGSLITLQVPRQNKEPVILIGTVVRMEELEINKFDIGITTSFKELDKIVTEEVGEILRNEPVLSP